MKHTLTFFFILLFAIPASSQTQNIDSLINVLNTKKMDSDEQMAIYSKICQIYLYSDPEKVIEYAEKGLALAKKEKDKNRASKFNDDLGKSYITRGNFDTALIYFNKSLDLAKEAKDKEQEACVYINLGVSFRIHGDLTTALEYYMKALPIYESTGNKANCATILSNVGSIHRTLKNPERALYYLNQAEEINKTIDNPLAKMNNDFELGCIYMDLKEYEKGLEYQQEVYEIAREKGYKNFEAASIQAIGAYYMQVKNYEKGLECANECLRLGKTTGDPRLIVGSYSILTEIYAIKGNWQECEAAAYEAWKIDSLDFHHPDILYKLILSNIRLGNKDKACDYLSSFYNLHIKSNDEDFHKILMDMEVKYETEKKEMRITSLEKERQLYIWLAVTGALLVIALGILLRQKIKNEQKKRQLTAANALQEGEIGERERLASELHDRLGGTLSAAKSELNNTKDILSVNNKLDVCIEEVRRITHNMMPLSLRFGIKAALEDYAAQFSNVHFHFFGEETGINKRLEFVIYCCANELITNSVKHSGAEEINVQLVQEENRIALTVQDDGCGFEKKTARKGIGLKNINDRVASCNGKIEIASSNGKGTETTIEFRPEKA